MLNLSQINELAQFDSPTVCNAIESFHIRPRTDGFMTPDIKSILKCQRPYIGYASTGKFSTAKPARQPISMKEYFEHVQNTPRPSISVQEDVDSPSVGALWGEVNANIHKALGAVAAVTNGGVRDLKEVDALGFGYFAKDIRVSHAYFHMVDFACPVVVGGLTIMPGDLLFCDSMGIVVIPDKISDKLAGACRRIAAAEWPVLQYVKQAQMEGTEINVDILLEKQKEMTQLRERVARNNENCSSGWFLPESGRY